MIDNEIIKALEWLIRCNEKHIEKCEGCPLSKEYPHCDENIAKDALDLISRQKATIEYLETKQMTFAKGFYRQCVKDIADRFQKHCTSIELKEYINTLVEELMGEMLYEKREKM